MSTIPRRFKERAEQLADRGRPPHLDGTAAEEPEEIKEKAPKFKAAVRRGNREYRGGPRRVSELSQKALDKNSRFEEGQ